LEPLCATSGEHDHQADVRLHVLRPYHEKALQAVGEGKALDTTRSGAKKRKAVEIEKINSDDDDESGNMLNMLRELVKGQREMNGRVDQLEAGVTDLPEADEDEDDEDDSGDEDSDDDDEHHVTKSDNVTRQASWKTCWPHGKTQKATRTGYQTKQRDAPPRKTRNRLAQKELLKPRVPFYA
jgi:hypothetical protein